jgi:hypothetical protein
MGCLRHAHHNSYVFSSLHKIAPGAARAQVYSSLEPCLQSGAHQLHSLLHAQAAGCPANSHVAYATICMPPATRLYSQPLTSPSPLHPDPAIQRPSVARAAPSSAADLDRPEGPFTKRSRLKCRLHMSHPELPCGVPQHLAACPVLFPVPLATAQRLSCLLCFHSPAPVFAVFNNPVTIYVAGRHL